MNKKIKNKTKSQYLCYLTTDKPVTQQSVYERTNDALFFNFGFNFVHRMYSGLLIGLLLFI